MEDWLTGDSRRANAGELHVPIHDPHSNRDHHSTVDRAGVLVPTKRARYSLRKCLAMVGITCLLGAFAMAQVIEPSSPSPSPSPNPATQLIAPVSSASAPVSPASVELASASSAPSPSSSIAATAVAAPAAVAEVVSPSRTGTPAPQEKSDTPVPPRSNGYRGQAPSFGVFLSASAPVDAMPASA